MDNIIEEAKWYVVHTYSGYEQKVRTNIEKIVENRKMHDLIEKVEVPMQMVRENKNGEQREVERKKLPGYVLIKMVMNDDTWYVVRNTRGVTSFVGPGSKPIPLTDAEIVNMGLEGNVITYDLVPGQAVKVIAGVFTNSIGVVEEVIAHKQQVKIQLSFFGRDTTTELSFDMLQKI
ncbi:MAG: transcription termination/antitermination protein NusG [Turicibacter sp.]|nr:transcription termination/antitermination protein NusG [Turicibacter sp.]